MGISSKGLSGNRYQGPQVIDEALVMRKVVTPNFLHLTKVTGRIVLYSSGGTTSKSGGKGNH